MTCFQEDSEVKETKQTDELDLLDKKLSTIGLKEGSKQPQRNTIPTRLPTPKGPVPLRHKSAEQLNNHIQENTNNNKPPASIQADPPPPNAKRVRHSSIARLVKIPTRERLLSETDLQDKKVIIDTDPKKVQKESIARRREILIYVL